LRLWLRLRSTWLGLWLWGTWLWLRRSSRLWLWATSELWLRWRLQSRLGASGLGAGIDRCLD
jgi:hypothetical protein